MGHIFNPSLNFNTVDLKIAQMLSPYPPKVPILTNSFPKCDRPIHVWRGVTPAKKLFEWNLPLICILFSKICFFLLLFFWVGFKLRSISFQRDTFLLEPLVNGKQIRPFTRYPCCMRTLKVGMKNSNYFPTSCLMGGNALAAETKWLLRDVLSHPLEKSHFGPKSVRMTC